MTEIAIIQHFSAKSTILQNQNNNEISWVITIILCSEIKKYLQVTLTTLSINPRKKNDWL